MDADLMSPTGAGRSPVEHLNVGAVRLLGAGLVAYVDRTVAERDGRVVARRLRVSEVFLTTRPGGLADLRRLNAQHEDRFAVHLDVGAVPLRPVRHAADVGREPALDLGRVVDR